MDRERSEKLMNTMAREGLWNIRWVSDIDGECGWEVVRNHGDEMRARRMLMVCRLVPNVAPLEALVSVPDGKGMDFIRRPIDSPEAFWWHTQYTCISLEYQHELTNPDYTKECVSWLLQISVAILHLECLLGIPMHEAKWGWRTSDHALAMFYPLGRIRLPVAAGWMYPLFRDLGQTNEPCFVAPERSSARRMALRTADDMFYNGSGIPESLFETSKTASMWLLPDWQFHTAFVAYIKHKKFVY